jgi:hypothetical protein
MLLYNLERNIYVEGYLHLLINYYKYEYSINNFQIKHYSI